MKLWLAAQPANAAEVRSRQVCARLLELPEVLNARTLMLYAPLRHEVDVTPIAIEWPHLVQRCDGRPASPASSPPPPPPAHCHHEAARAALFPHPRLCVPALNFATKEMWPAHITNWSADLVLNRLGLREPIPTAPRVALNELDVVIVPALAFDHQGHRLGRGGGFYDRFLATLPPHVRTIGVAFNAQLLLTIPTDPHDFPVHLIITNEQTLRH